MSEARANDSDDDLTNFPAGMDSGGSPGAQRAGVYDFPAEGTKGRRTMLAVTGVFALLALACVIAACLAWRDVKASDAALNAREWRLTGSLVLEALLDAETSQRGFLLTRDPAYLANYDGAKSRFARSLAELKEQAPRATLTRDVARTGVEKFAEMDQTISLAQSGQFDEAVAVVLMGHGKAYMDELRHTVDDLTAAANDDVARTAANQKWVSALLVGAIVIALGCVAGLAALLLNDARRHFGLLETRESSARQLAQELDERVARRTHELAEVNQRFDAALRASGITVMTQDRDLVFTWISRGIFGHSPRDIIGKPQQAVISEATPGAAVNLKRGVVESGEPARGDVRLLHNGVESWYDLTVHPLKDEYGAVTGIIAGATDITRYKEQEARIRLLMRELTHRSKNLLTVIQAIMRQTAANSTSIDDFETRFSARLQSLAGAHDLLVQEDWQGASMRELVRSQLGHYTDRVGSQIVLTGDPLQIPPDAAQHIGMAMHELATNAAKYGALSTPAGTVRVSWVVSLAADGKPICHLTWEESGGPPVERPARRGFGRVVIERTVARALNGEVRIDYAPEGLRWTLEFPVVAHSAA